jgi:uncharacterized membrane protein YraQ (UPF0718 family)
MAFWLSSPLIDPPTLLITAGALGWEFAIGKAVFAVALGLFGGALVAFAIRSGLFLILCVSDRLSLSLLWLWHIAKDRPSCVAILERE